MLKNGKKILHVDDDKDTLTVVKKILEKEGFEVVGVESGKGALDEIKKNKFDLILLDIMMPDMSGWELFTKIIKKKPSSVVIFLTVLEISDKKLEKLKETGVKDYIAKPFDRDDLVRRINNVLYV